MSIFLDFSLHNKIDIVWLRLVIPKNGNKYAFARAQQYYEQFDALPMFF